MAFFFVNKHHNINNISRQRSKLRMKATGDEGLGEVRRARPDLTPSPSPREKRKQREKEETGGPSSTITVTTRPFTGRNCWRRIFPDGLRKKLQVEEYNPWEGFVSGESSSSWALIKTWPPVYLSSPRAISCTYAGTLTGPRPNKRLPRSFPLNSSRFLNFHDWVRLPVRSDSLFRCVFSNAGEAAVYVLEAKRGTLSIITTNIEPGREFPL